MVTKYQAANKSQVSDQTQFSMFEFRPLGLTRSLLLHSSCLVIAVRSMPQYQRKMDKFSLHIGISEKLWEIYRDAHLVWPHVEARMRSRVRETQFS